LCTHTCWCVTTGKAPHGNHARAPHLVIPNSDRDRASTPLPGAPTLCEVQPQHLHDNPTRAKKLLSAHALCAPAEHCPPTAAYSRSLKTNTVADVQTLCLQRLGRPPGCLLSRNCCRVITHAAPPVCVEHQHTATPTTFSLRRCCATEKPVGGRDHRLPSCIRLARGSP
jgi:hypothetical protein